MTDSKMYFEGFPAVVKGTDAHPVEAGVVTARHDTMGDRRSGYLVYP